MPNGTLREQQALYTKYFSAFQPAWFISPQFIAGRERSAKRGFQGDVFDP
ncbi:hypothetical protein [Calothrix rhizosoleniae]|nr:hypothetical protein [Calothrix rhizosoleniae]